MNLFFMRHGIAVDRADSGQRSRLTGSAAADPEGD